MIQPKRQSTDRICDVCRERPATRFIFYGQTGEVRSICATCFEKVASGGEAGSHCHMEKVLENARCRYCGDPAVEVSVHYGIPGLMKDITEAWCANCRVDLKEFNQQPENAIPDFDVEDEAGLEAASRILEGRRLRQEEFMRERVRRPKGLVP